MQASVIIRWNEDKCKCECKKLIDNGSRCDKYFFWNPSDCNFECDKSCDVGYYLDYKNCKCRNKIVDDLVKECSGNVYENEMIYNETLNDHKKVCGSCTLCIALFAIFLIINIIISSVFIYFHWYLKKDNTNAYY